MKPVRPLATPVDAGRVTAVEPKVRLVAYTAQPLALAVASARTCYASDFAFVGRLGPKGERTRTTLEAAIPQYAGELAVIGDSSTPNPTRVAVAEKLQAQIDSDDVRAAIASFADLARQRAEGDVRIAHDIWRAGHHTPFQHPTFVFSLEGLSRNVVESFLHNHIFYNSEQQSQRYVEMGEARVHVPAAIAADPEARRIYDDAVGAAWGAYHDLRERLIAPNLKVMGAIGRIKGQAEKKIHSEAEKKAQEMARYVIPICAQTQLYHTVSGLVLLRYVRMCEANNTASEARAVVEAMVGEVRKVDPAFLEQIHEETRGALDQVESSLIEASPAPLASTEGHTSLLIRHTPDAVALVVDAEREVTGSRAPARDLLARVLDPNKNPSWNDTLNTWDHSPALRSLRHVHYTFRKRLSLTAYAQDQRHRLTPGTRPLLSRCLTEKPDVYTPDIITSDAEARRIFDAAIGKLWSAMHELRRRGISADDATYLLPNATCITFTQSGDLLSLIHKWRLRLCFNAQKEIFDASLDELRQVQAIHPDLAQWIGPPCSFVAAAQPPEKQDDIAACCPEGDKWCGVKVWKNFDAATGKPKRPY